MAYGAAAGSRSAKLPSLGGDTDMSIAFSVDSILSEPREASGLTTVRATRVNGPEVKVLRCLAYIKHEESTCLSGSWASFKPSPERLPLKDYPHQCHTHLISAEVVVYMHALGSD